MIRKMVATGGLALALAAGTVLPATAAQAAPGPGDGMLYLWECVNQGGGGALNWPGTGTSPTGMWCTVPTPAGDRLPIELDPQYGYCLPGTILWYYGMIVLTAGCI
ncbi:hypothetical protein [Actinoplanes sp. N902-109]|uniref:hypothetical protein n=1 Tax=Actinoplanes sp. (strain N902-109) TaxID=649831 RepID=UPI0003295499|nr:hypothetical protein [Actinoplanes sp. N902-109]AGL19921.1 hypothetical protein L083_6411 [Actinoplanes sp. N902-109]